MIKGRPVLLSLAADGALPTEFRLFQRGWNETENGKFLFDYSAAKSVMAAYQSWGIDLPIDLEHQMIKLEGGEPDPTARDARGWCKLQIRNGELWAVDVKWTPDGAQRLTNKTQRYISPAFESDPKSKRVLKMINVAITALPATHKTPALVAAAVTGAKPMMSKDMVEAALEALQEGDDAKATEILKSMIASAASGETPGDGDAEGSADGGAEGTAPPKESTETVEDPKVVASSDDPTDEDDDDGDKPEKKMARKALRKMLLSVTGAGSFAEALSAVADWKKSHVTLESERQELAKQRAVLESAERRKLVVELVTLGAEFPSTVWADDKAKALKPRWAKLPIEELRSHVSEQRAARGEKKDPKPPAGSDPVKGDDVVETVTLSSGVVVQLSANEVKAAKDMGCELKDFAALKAFRDGKK